jgi:hypothetical protein
VYDSQRLGWFLVDTGPKGNAVKATTAPSVTILLTNVFLSYPIYLIPLSFLSMSIPYNDKYLYWPSFSVYIFLFLGCCRCTVTHKCALWAILWRLLSLAIHFSSALVLAALSLEAFCHRKGVLSYSVGLCYSARAEFSKVGIVSSA